MIHESINIEKEYAVSKERQKINGTQLSIMSSLSLNCENLLNIQEDIIQGIQFDKTSIDLDNKALSNNTQKGIIQELSNKVNNLLLLKTSNFIGDSTQQYKNSILNIESLIPRIEGLLSLGINLNLENNIEMLNDQLTINAEKKQNLNKKYNLHECSSCSGLGVLPS